MPEIINEEFYYTTVQQEGSAVFTDRGSKFIAYTFPINELTDFKQKLAQLKKEHLKAVHHCFAYRLGLDGNNYRSSDDGEPSGSAGKPILGQIDSNQLTNVLVVVVRYFGGTLLGVPGLINAYKSATALALQVTPFAKKQVLESYRLQFDYTQINEVMRIVKQFDCCIRKQDLQLFCSMDIGVPKIRLQEVVNLFRYLQNVSIEKM